MIFFVFNHEAKLHPFKERNLFYIPEKIPEKIPPFDYRCKSSI